MNLFLFWLMENNLFSQLVLCWLHEVYNCNPATHTQSQKNWMKRYKKPAISPNWVLCMHASHVFFTFPLFFSYWFSTTCNIMSWNKEIKTLTPESTAFFLCNRKTICGKIWKLAALKHNILQTDRIAYRKFLLTCLYLELPMWLWGSLGSISYKGFIFGWLYFSF